MKMTGNFTQIPDAWWKLCGKHYVVDEDTGEVLMDSNGKERTVTISHWMVVLLAKIESFNLAKYEDGKETIYRCTASNAYFADLLGVSKGTVRNAISDLYSLGLLKSYETMENGYTTTRFLYVNLGVLNRMLEQEE